MLRRGAREGGTRDRGEREGETNIRQEWTRKEIVEEHGGVERRSNSGGLNDE